MKAEMEGTVKWFDAKKGYGFINGDDGREIYVHYTGIVSEGFRTLDYGKRVEYEIADTERGREAVNVRIVRR